MSILSSASSASVWRGYEYYNAHKVTLLEQISADEYTGKVAGNAPAPYSVKINITHIRQSKCNCPHADGKRIICKHMVALYFSAFPQEAAQYIASVEEYEKEEEARITAHYAEIEEYVNSLSKKELREALYNALIEAEEYERNQW